MAIIDAAISPAPESFNSLVNWYVTKAVNEEKRGARKTHTLRTSMVMWKKCMTWYKIADVTIKPAK